MQVTLPDLTPQQFGQMVLKLSAKSIPGTDAATHLVLQHIATGLAQGALTIIERGQNVGG